MPGGRYALVYVYPIVVVERTVTPCTHKLTVACVGGFHAEMQDHAAIGTAGFVCCLGQCREWSCCSLHHTLCYWLGTR